MRSLLKKTLSVLVAIVVTLGMLPLMASAENESGISIQYLTEPSSPFNIVGNTVEIDLVLYNNTPDTVSYNSSKLLDKNGIQDTAANMKSSTQYEDGSMVPAGEDWNLSYELTITQADADAGALVRTFTQNAVGVFSHTSYSTTFNINILLRSPIIVEVKSHPTTSTAGLGEPIEVVYGFFNESPDYVSFNKYNCYDGKGDVAIYYDLQPSDEASMVAPGDSLVVTITYRVNQNDLDKGEMYRLLEQKATIAVGNNTYTAAAVAVTVPLSDASEPSLTEINNITITGVNEPDLDKIISHNWSIPTDGYYEKYADSNSDTCAWVMTDAQPTSLNDLDNYGTWYYPSDSENINFQADKFYTFFTMVQPKNGYKFGESTTAKINGKNAIVGLGADNSYTVVWHTFSPLEEVTEQGEGETHTDPSVTVTPENPTVERGSQLDLDAIVTGFDNTSVTWELYDSHVAGTTINRKTGLLTVAKNETANRIGVKVTPNGQKPSEDYSVWFWVKVTGTIVPDTETITINVQKIVTGAEAPAETFSFNVTDGNGMPFTDPTGAGPLVTGNTISTNGAGEYPFVITITGTTAEIAAVKQLGINVTEASKTDWDCDTTEYIVRWIDNAWRMYDAAGVGVVETAVDYGDALDYLEFVNNYSGNESKEPLFFVAVDIVKNVVMGGNVTPPSQDFEFEIFTDLESQLDMDLITVRGNKISTNGVGSYRITLTIETNDAGMADLLSNGFFIREKNSAAADWTYSNTRYHLIYAEETEWQIGRINEQRSTETAFVYDDIVDVAEFDNTYTATQQGSVDPEIPHMDTNGKLFLLVGVVFIAGIFLFAIVVLGKNRKRRYSK